MNLMSSLKTGFYMGFAISTIMEHITSHYFQNEMLQLEPWYALNTAKQNYGINAANLSPEETKDYLKDIFLIQQAFEDCGYKGPVNVKIHIDEIYKEVGATLNVAYNEKWQQEVTVAIEYPLSYKLDDEYMYGIAGHEAIHFMHQHRILQLFTSGFFWGAIFPLLSDMTTSLPILPRFTVISGIYMGVIMPATLYYLLPASSYICEYDADVFAARNLGTSEIMQSYHQDAPEPTTSFTHPSPQNRRFMLRTFANSSTSPLLFQGQRLQQIEKKIEDEMASISHSAP